MGRGVGGGIGMGNTCNPWLIHVNVWQKPLQYCKVISLQLTKINEKKKKIYAQADHKPPQPALKMSCPNSLVSSGLFRVLIKKKKKKHHVRVQVKFYLGQN